MSSPVQFIQTEEKCQRCKEKLTILISRKEKFCSDCFIWFIRGKQRKQMIHERYKVKYGDVAKRLGIQRVLLALSFGKSSLVLFDMIASLLMEQNLAHHGKQGFELLVVHLVLEKRAKSPDFDSLAKKYSPVNVKYIEVDVAEYFADPCLDLVLDGNGVFVRGDSKRPDLSINSPLSEGSSVPTTGSSSLTTGPRSLNEDLLSAVQSQLLLRIAKQNDCQTILYGSTMSRLAHEVISLTVKGRGLRVCEEIADRTVLFEGKEIHVIFPFREILHGEISAVLALSSHLEPYVEPDHVPPSRIVKNMTVQELTKQYFDTLDATGYSSTASTVVKTAEKLGGSKIPETGTCEICSSPIHGDPKVWKSHITVNTAAPLNSDEEREYFSQYTIEALGLDLEVLTPREQQGREISVCYGCSVTVNTLDGLLWPVRASKQEILDEFVLPDEE